MPFTYDAPTLFWCAGFSICVLIEGLCECDTIYTLNKTSDKHDPNPEIVAPPLLWLSTMHYCPIDLTEKFNPYMQIEEHNSITWLND